MKAKAVVGGVFVLSALAFGANLALLDWSARKLVTKFQLDGEPTFRLPFDLARKGTKKQRAWATAAVAGSVGVPWLTAAGMGISMVMPPKRELHGSAKLASMLDLQKSGLLTADKPDDDYPSFLVGKVGKKFLYFRGQQFMFLSAPTRSGKGVSCVIPNLLHYRDSVVVQDFKDENWLITAGFRAACGQEVHRFAPDDETFNTSCWNPLFYVRDDPLFRISDLMSITNILYPPSPEDVWASTAESLFLGLALYVMDTAKMADDLNLATLKKLRVSLACLKDEETFIAHVKEREPFEPLSEECITHLRSYSQTSDKIRNSIAISFDAPLAIFADPVTAVSTSKNTFDLRQVRRKRMSIYLSIKPKNVDKFGRLLNLFYQQLLTLNMDVLPKDDPTLICQCALMADEFPAAGRIAMIEKASAYMAGYNMRLMLIFQSKSQLEDRRLYDQSGTRTLLTNMALQVCFAPRDDEDAKDYSEMIGYMTEKSVSKSRQLGMKPGRSESTSPQRRAVLLPQEVKEIGKTKALLSLENMRPALVDKICWYEDPTFKARANMPVPRMPNQMPLRNGIEEGAVSPVLQYVGSAEEAPMPGGSTFEVGFSPKRNALEVVMSLILNAKSELLVAAYSFTSKEIAFALTEAKGRGVDVRVVVDHAQNGGDQAGYKAVDFLEGQGVPVFRSENYAAMHHKFMVADGSHVQLGSFNYTASANVRNAETAIVFRHAPDLAQVYRAEWLRLASEPKVSVQNIVAIDAGLALMKELGISLD